METRQRRARGSGRESRLVQDQGEEQGSVANQNQGPRGDGGDQGQVPGNQQRDPEVGEDRALERFQKFAPPKFLGGPEPEVAENWFQRMEDIFAALHYTEEKQVTFTVFQLEGAARSWWNVVRTKWDREQTPQYETQFTRLSKFAPELVVSEQKRIRRFVQRLNVEIQKDLDAAQIDTFKDALEKAQRVEQARFQVRTFQAKRRCTSSSAPGRGDQNVPPLKFGRGHIKDACWRKLRKCLRCGSFEHQLAGCPVKNREGNGCAQPEKSNPKQSTTSGSRPKSSARVFALDYQRAPESSEVVEEVKTPTGDQSLITNMIYRNCEIRVGERKLVGDLISLDLKGYDVIIGMDLLARYNAQLNCKTKVVEFSIPCEVTLKFDVRGKLASSALVSGIRARKLSSKRAQGYLAFLINTPGDKVKLEDVLVVNEFPNVFPDELMSIPPEREIEFKIDLVPGTAPIAKTPYRMAPAEIKELKL
ncbi:uncharacterized protein LOC113768942 [Coffea eugenioides]|uniref:uncharacterized protein LOC113768942 n=1 Tax=Coffea eugenioides TaxID=49369 RepID=UPI000F614253|nr:uncharacterized protein LOC113768942 [Coffea eugenioides]